MLNSQIALAADYLQQERFPAALADYLHLKRFMVINRRNLTKIRFREHGLQWPDHALAFSDNDITSEEEEESASEASDTEEDDLIDIET